jgi:uncharacterized membrane protein YesL
MKGGWCKPSAFKNEGEAMRFDYDSPIIRFLNKGADLLILNILFIVCSLPVVTIGASLTAMYAVNLRSVRYGDGYVVQTFFKSFKQSFVQATIAWIIVAACGLLIFFDIRFWSVMGEGMIQKVMLAVSYALAGILFMIFRSLLRLYFLVIFILGFSNHGAQIFIN